MIFVLSIFLTMLFTTRDIPESSLQNRRILGTNTEESSWQVKEGEGERKEKYCPAPTLFHS